MFKPGLLIYNDLARYRFRRFTAAGALALPVPVYVDRRDEMLPASDQGSTSKCGAYAMAGVIEYYRWKTLGVKEQVDPDPIYARAKEIDGFPKEEGTTLEAVAQASIDLGLLRINPLSFRTVSDPADVKRALHQYGVVLAGFGITEGWQKAKPDGWLEEGGAYLGGHAVVLVGYADDETPQWYAVQNSWGEAGVGWRGFVRMKPSQFQSEFHYGLVWDMLP